MGIAKGDYGLQGTALSVMQLLLQWRLQVGWGSEVANVWLLVLIARKTLITRSHKQNETPQKERLAWKLV
jgi:hypothetical protein